MRRSYSSVQKNDLSYLDVNGVEKSTQTTANCYVIKQPGTYLLPLVYGNAITNSETNSSAYTKVESRYKYAQPFYNYLNNQITSPFIETDTGVQANSARVIYTDVPSESFSITNLHLVENDLCTYLSFTVGNFPYLGGNAVIGIVDSNNIVMWSWHIWAYADTLTTIPHTNSPGYTYNMLNVNLGWVKDSSISKYGTSPYYQWGRKDPMLRADSYSSSTNATVGYGSWSISTAASSVASTIQNPNVFNKQGGSINAWWQCTSYGFCNYWDAGRYSLGYTNTAVVKTVYDPCPAGYAIPNGNAFTGVATTNGGTWDRGYTWDGRYFSTNGYRDKNGGGLNAVGNEGYYFLAHTYSSSTNYNYSLSFSSGHVYPQNYYESSYGFSVCPVTVE